MRLMEAVALFGCVLGGVDDELPRAASKPAQVAHGATTGQPASSLSAQRPPPGAKLSAEAVTAVAGPFSQNTTPAGNGAAQKTTPAANGAAQNTMSAGDAAQNTTPAVNGAAKNTTPAATLPAQTAASAAPTGAIGESALDPAVKALVQRMQAFYEGTSDFTADFTQNYTYTGSKRKLTSTGSMTFKKPGLMRWEYAKPSPKSFVLAGDKVYMHDPEAKLLTRAKIDTSQLSASVTFLWGKGNLLDEFNIAKAACTHCKGTLLELVPKQKDPRFRKLHLEVDPKTAQVVRSVVFDPDGSQNAISFSNMKTNVGINEKTFVLTPPEGTQMQDFIGASAK